ncbi:MAG: hypothetical protein IPK27_06410 [Rhodanobacteraceae bacterium]|nr:hypothetical protein [Rhodanobacteraceae bacterium]
MEFPRKLVAKELGSNREFEFIDSVEFLKWARAESEYWRVEERTLYQALDAIIGGQVSFYNNLISNVESFESNPSDPLFAKIQHRFNEPLEKGQVLTSSHPQAGVIVETLKVDPTSGALRLLANLPFQKQIEILTNHTVPICAALLRTFSTTQGSLGCNSTLDNARREISAVLSKLDKDHNSAIEFLKNERSKFDELATDQLAALKTWGEEQKQSLARLDANWSELKDFVKNELATSAPVDYWKNRATRCKNAARMWGVVFLVLCAAALGMFWKWGVPLIGTDDSKATFVALLPIVLPAFIFIWLLRLVARLISDNISLMRDGEERATMINAFLALAREKGAEKPLIRADDQLLILNALFRPSAVSGVDDSPPVGILEHLLRTTKKP